MGGVLHHINDPLARHLLGLLKRSPDLVSVLTYDAVYLPKDILNNVLASLDRGRHSKTPEGYIELAQSAGFTVTDTLVRTYSPTGGLGKFFAMTLEPLR
jgi:hypothetical protein